MVNEYLKDGLVHLVIGNDLIEVMFLPERGSKMISLINKKTGTEFLLENQDKNKEYKKPFYGADYSEYDTSGFDECFPTIEASELKIEDKTGRKKIISYPDHGELWSKEWNYEISGDAVMFNVSGVHSDYEIIKHVTLKKNQLKFDYKLMNNSGFPLYYIWAAHPLLAVDEGDRIIMPAGADKLFLNWSSDKNMGRFGEYIKMNGVNGSRGNKRFYNVESRNRGIAVKGFTDSLKYGFTGLFRAKKNESVLISFDNKKLPYLGVWLCYGGWPAGLKEKHYTVALEPATGRPDSLSESVKRNECSLINPGEEKTWYIEFSLWEGIPDYE